MSDFTTVYFTWIKRGFNIPSTLVEFSLFGNEISIKFYGVIIAFGFILAALFGGRMAYKWRISLDKMLDVLIYGTLAGIMVRVRTMLYSSGTIISSIRRRYRRSGRADSPSTEE